MAIAFGAIGTKAGVGTTTEAIAYPASVGAGDLLLACRCIWLGTATADNEPGWTAAGRLSGGTGTAVDDHTTIAAADWTEAAGGETGSVTFDQTGATGIMAAMLRYTKGAGTTWDVTAQTGDDATHGADRSVTLSSSHTVAVGDWVVAVVAVDTNTTLAGVASPAFSGTATFGTVNRRTSGTGTSTGNDGNIEVWDAEVTGAGTCTGFSFTTTTTQCGPVDIVRLREIAGGTTTVGTSRSATWHVRATANASRATTWRTLATTTASRATTWRVRATTIASRATSWRVLGTATATRATTWHVRAAVAAQRATIWRVLTATAATRATTWRVLQRITGTRSTTWNVLSSLVTVGASRATSWRVLAPVASTRATTWNVRATVSAARSTLWDVLTTATASRATSWRVLTDATAARSTTWRVLERITALRTALWNVLSDALPMRLTAGTPRTNRHTTAAPRPPATTVGAQHASRYTAGDPR